MPRHTKRAVVVFSGGMDSYTLMMDVRSRGYEVFAITFDYGQRHAKEVMYARRACFHEGIHHTVVEMPGIGRQIIGSSALTGGEPVPHGHHEDESMRATVVPNRNMIMLSLAIGYAVAHAADAVYIGAHSGDHAIYPDCRPAFIERMNDVAKVANYQSVRVVAPYLDIDKGGIAAIGGRLGLDYTRTWTCYEGGDVHCGKCGACQERIEAMAAAGIKDRTEYAG